MSPTEIHDLPDPEEYVNDPAYYPTKDMAVRQKICIHSGISIEEYRARIFRNRITGSRVHADFPDGMPNKTNYDGSVKGLAFLLSNECNVSTGKIKKLFESLSGGLLKVSEATINGLSEEFSSKTGEGKKESIKKIMTSPVINTDFTNANVNGKTKQVLIIATPGNDAAVFIARENKGHKGISFHDSNVCTGNKYFWNLQICS